MEQQREHERRMTDSAEWRELRDSLREMTRAISAHDAKVTQFWTQMVEQQKSMVSVVEGIQKMSFKLVMILAGAVVVASLGSKALELVGKALL